MKKQSAGGITYLEAGHGAGAPVICLHGIGADATSFHHQMKLPHHRMIAWNMPGYGGSDPLDHLTFDTLSDRLGDLIEALGRSRAHLVGQSIGGMIALTHAIRQPDQVQSLSLVATTPRFGGRDESFRDAFLEARIGPLNRGQSMADMARETVPNLVGPNCTDNEAARIEACLARVPEATWRAILACLVTFDRAADLDHVFVPTTVIAGSLDLMAPAKTMEKMAARIPGAGFHLLEGAGHMLHQEMPEAFNALLTEFLSGDHA